MKSQDEIFLSSEGDAWFERNAQWLTDFDPNDDPVLVFIERSGLKPRKVLEIGAANGARLQALAKTTGCAAVAVEPSAEAVEDGRKRFPDVEFHRATADAIPNDEDGAFDLIIVHFVYHWVGRERLMRTMAETDRLLADNGFLLIGDFLPYKPTRVPYHHLPDEKVYTYKQNYAELMLASGLYSVVRMEEASHGGSAERPNEQDRIGYWLLRKSLEGYYTEL